jgi:hypothetical protein
MERFSNREDTYMKFEEKRTTSESIEDKKASKEEIDQAQGDAMEEFLKNTYDINNQDNESAAAKATEKEDSPQVESPVENVATTASTRGNMGDRGSRGNFPQRKSAEKVISIADARSIRESKDTEPRGRGKREGLREEPAGKIIDAETSFAQRRKEANEARRQKETSGESVIPEEITPESTKKSPLEVGLEAGKQRTDKIFEKTQNKIKELTDRGGKWMNEHVPNMLNYAMGSPEMMKSGMEQVKNKAQKGYEGIKEKARGYKERFSGRIREAKGKFFDATRKIGLKFIDKLLIEIQTNIEIEKGKERKKKEKVDKQEEKVKNAIFFKGSAREKLAMKKVKLEMAREKVARLEVTLKRVRDFREGMIQKRTNPTETGRHERVARFAEAA